MSAFCLDSQIFFICEDKRLEHDEEEIKDQILYFFPSSMENDLRDRHVGMLLGMKQSFAASFKSPPSVIRLQHSKYVMKHIGDYTLVYGASKKTHDLLATRQLDLLYDIFCFYFHSFENLFELCENNKENFISRLSSVWNTLLPYVRHYDDCLSAAFNVLPYWQFPQNRNNCSSGCRELIDKCVNLTSAKGGCLLFRDKFVYSTVCPNIMSKLLILKPRHTNFPCLHKQNLDFDLPDGVWIVEAVLNEDDWEDQKRFDADLDENVQAFSSNDSKIQSTSYEDQQSVLSLPLERTHQEDLSSSDRFISSWPGVEKMIHGNKIQTKFSEKLTSTCPRGAEILKNTELSKASEASSDEAISKKIESSEAIGNNAISKTILSSEAISVEASSEANSDEAITKKIELTEAICNYTISTEIASSEASIVEAKALDESTNLTLNNLGKVQECVKHNICEDETDYVESDAFKMQQENCSAYTTKENFNGCAVIPVCDTDSDYKFVDTNQQMDLNIRPLDNSSNVQLNGEVICSDNLQHLNNSENSTLCEELLHLIGDKTALKNNNSADTVSTNGIKTDILSTNDSSTDIASANGSNTDSILSEYVNVSSSIVAVQNCQKSQSNGNLNASDKFTQSIDGSVNSSDIPFVQCSQNEAETNSIHTLSMYSNNAAAPNVYVPKYTPVTLYAQANSDMVLILLLDEQSVALHKAIVRDIWMRSISSFAKFEPQLKDMAEEAKSQQLLQSNASSWLCYNKASHAFQGSLSALHPVSVADHAFCEAASLIHEDFHSIEGPTEILLRSGVGTIYAHSEGSTEIFVKSPVNKVYAGIPSRRDVESCIKIAQQKLKDLPPINSQ